MAITLRNTPWADGTTVGAYDATGYDRFPASGPLGPATETAVVSDSEVFFESLVNGVYFAAAKVGSEWRSIRFMPGEGVSGPPEDWHVVGDNGEPEYAKLETEKGPQDWLIVPGGTYPGYGTKWTREEPNPYSERLDFGIPSLAFYKDPFDVVHFRGGVQPTLNAYPFWDDEKEEEPSWLELGANPGFDGGEIFTLPSGYRPDATVYFPWVPIERETGQYGRSDVSVYAVHPSGLVTVAENYPTVYEPEVEIQVFDSVSFRAA
jgi:hypothetical protein